MKSLLLVAAALLPALAAASPVHIALRPVAAVQADAAGEFLLGSVADLSGGAPSERAKLAAVPVGRAPLPEETRDITSGDLALKLRQAGFQPGRDAVVGGAGEAQITLAQVSLGASPSVLPEAGASKAPPLAPPAASAPPPVLVRAGAPVTICLDEGSLSITASGVAESSGAAGDSIRVRRAGTDAEMQAVVIDSQTVELEQ